MFGKLNHDRYAAGHWQRRIGVAGTGTAGLRIVRRQHHVAEQQLNQVVFFYFDVVEVNAAHPGMASCCQYRAADSGRLTLRECDDGELSGALAGAR